MRNGPENKCVWRHWNQWLRLITHPINVSRILSLKRESISVCRNGIFPSPNLAWRAYHGSKFWVYSSNIPIGSFSVWTICQFSLLCVRCQKVFFFVFVCSLAVEFCATLVQLSACATCISVWCLASYSHRYRVRIVYRNRYKRFAIYAMVHIYFLFMYLVDGC